MDDHIELRLNWQPVQQMTTPYWFAALLVALELIPRLGLVNPIALVPLSEMVWQLWLLLTDGILGSHIVRTLTSIVAAGALAVVTGLPLGVLLWRLDRVKRVLAPYMTTYYAIPIFAFYPLFIAIFEYPARRRNSGTLVAASSCSTVTGLW